MKRILLSLFLLGATNAVFAQTVSTITFKLRYKVYLKGNPHFPIMYSGQKEKKEEVTSRTYSPSGLSLLSETKAVTEGWFTAIKFDPLLYNIKDSTKYLYADLVQSDDKSKIYIYFWPFKEQSTYQYNVKAASQQHGLIAGKLDFNEAVKNGNFYIALDSRQYLKFKSKALHAGPMTMPFKVYLSSRDTSHVSNVAAAVSAGAYFGWKWGSTGFVNLPAEKADKMHQKFLSLNLIGGFTKIDVTAANSINKSTREGSALGISPGVAMGFHYDSFAIFTALGTDIPFGNITDQWRYKNQPWLGFGVGFSIL